MDINLKSPKSIAKVLGMALLLGAASIAALKGLAWLIDKALPGKGQLVKAPFRLD